MIVHNREIAEIFDTIADLLSIENANPFRIRAYQDAAETIASYPESIAAMVTNKEDLTELPGIGKDLATKIKTIVKTGHLPFLNKLTRRTPLALREFLSIPGLGPKGVGKIFRYLKITSWQSLKEAAQNQQIREIPGFGEKTELMILNAIEKNQQTEKRTLWADAQVDAEELRQYLKKFKGIKSIDIAGSYRRCVETIGDIDILVIAKKGAEVSDYFLKFPKIEKIIAKGSTRASMRLQSGLQVDLRIVPQISHGAALLYFTGSKNHNISLRKMAIQKGLLINEYGVFRDKKRISGKTEKEIYSLFSMQYIEPELRENRGELEAAKTDHLPKLITIKDIRGDLHCPIAADENINHLVKDAKSRGYEYIAVAGQIRQIAVAKTQDKKRLLQLLKIIDKLNETLTDIHILKTAEVNILENGSLDLADKILAELDFTICSIETKFNLSEKKQTERILRAMDHRYFNILGHPTCRILNKYPGLNIDIEKILNKAKENKCLVELNSQPNRLDLNDFHCKLAKEIGVKIVISSNASNANEFSNINYGINQARRGWLTAEDVVNTQPLNKFLNLIKKNK